MKYLGAIAIFGGAQSLIPLIRTKGVFCIFNIKKYVSVYFHLNYIIKFRRAIIKQNNIKLIFK